jgi:hypothetical protein
MIAISVEFLSSMIIILAEVLLLSNDIKLRIDKTSLASLDSFKTVYLLTN